jgi:uncharacterized glyoxalase superfamily protein PhnB
MPQTIVPMIHVPSVAAAIDWYVSLGFALLRQNDEHGETNWAKLSFEDSEIMLDSGGKHSSEQRREVDLYITIANLNEFYKHLNPQIEIVEEPHDTFYGMREFVIRDINGFWITFGQPV